MKKSIKDIESVVSSHGCGQKKVLLSKDETSTNLTQVAVIYLKAGEEGKPPDFDTNFEDALLLF